MTTAKIPSKRSSGTKRIGCTIDLRSTIRFFAFARSRIIDDCLFTSTRWPEVLTKKIKCSYCCIFVRTVDLIASDGGRLQVNKSVTSDEGCDGMAARM